MKVSGTLLTIALAATVISSAADTATTDQSKDNSVAPPEHSKASPTLTNEERDHAAKGMFRSQLEAPEQPLNVGIQYWIELKRPKGEARAVNNKTVFHSGDRIKFHLTPNIDGYAYVVMKTGNKGQPAVLFPDADETGKNRVTHGQEIVLPAGNDAFEFNETPGVEELTLFVARKPLDPTVYLQGPGEAIAEKKTARLPMVAINCGGNDRVPGGVFISYSNENHGAKGMYFEAAPAVMAKTTIDHNVHMRNNQQHIDGTRDSDLSSSDGLPPAAPSESGAVTVVSNDAGGVLAADITLQHF